VNNDDLSAIYTKRKLPAILGNETFLKVIKDHCFTKKRHSEVPESRLLAPGKDTIISAVCTEYNVPLSDVLASRRGHINEPRNVAMYLMRYKGRYIKRTMQGVWT